MSKYLTLISKYRSALMGFAILWIMFYHYPMHISNTFLFTIKCYGYGGVDIFLFLSGLGLYFSMSKNNISVRQFYKKRFMRILPEFWLFLLLVFILSFDYSLKRFWELLCCASTLGYWIRVIPHKLWFVSCILFLYAIYPIYFKLFKRHGTKATIAVISIGLILILLYALVMVFVFDNKNVGNTLVLTISRIPIFFIGSHVGHLIKDRCSIQSSNIGKVLLLGLFGIGVFTLLFFSIRFPDYLWTCALLQTPFILITPGLCVILAIIFNFLPNTVTQFFTKIGIISFELYLAHDYTFSIIMKFEKICGPLLSVVIIMVLTFVFAILLYKINKQLLQKGIARWLR